MDNVIVMGHSTTYRLEKALADFKKKKIDGWELYQIVQSLGFKFYRIESDGKMTVSY